LLDELNTNKTPKDKYRFGFHLPPHTSIFHIHLHCFIGPFSNQYYDKVQYGSLLKPVEIVIKKLEHLNLSKL
jgi:hypothetical protein